MTKRRKTRAPIVSVEALKDFKESIQDRELLRLAYRLEFFEDLRKSKKLNTPFIALEALGAFAGGKENGRSEEDLQSCWPKEWGTETITLPLSLILALREGWHDYKNAPTGKKLGESFKIEGGRQGNHPMKTRLATIDRARKLAREVESRYLRIEGDPDSLPKNEVMFEVAIAYGVGFETVKDACDAYSIAMRRELEALRILKG